MENTYEAREDPGRSFRSRRKENQAFYSKVRDDYSEDWNEKKFSKKFTWEHIRARKTTMPIHMKNIDRHGMLNLKKAAVKPLDRF